MAESLIVSAEEKELPFKVFFWKWEQRALLSKEDFCLVFVPLGSLKLSLKGFDKVSG